jgi:hypothetical protein
MHGSIMLLAGHFKFTVELVHATNQLVPLLLQPLKCCGIRECPSSGINRLLAGSNELLG